MKVRFVSVLAASALLGGCTVFESFDAEIDAVGRQIVEDWKKLPSVAAAQYEYRHGLDLGQHMTVEVMLHADKATPAAVDEVVQIAQRDLWRGTWKDFGLGYLVYSTDDPPYADKKGSGRAVRQGDVELPDELVASYGPRPTRPSK